MSWKTYRANDNIDLSNSLVEDGINSGNTSKSSFKVVESSSKVDDNVRNELFDICFGESDCSIDFSF
jgi:hypothetical protein